MTTTFKQLQKENAEIRDSISDIIEEWDGDKEEFWILINSLVENELKQEEMCDNG